MPSRKVSSGNPMHRSSLAALLLVLAPAVVFALILFLSADRRAAAQQAGREGDRHLVVEVHGSQSDLAQALAGPLSGSEAPPRIRLIGDGFALIEIAARELDALRARIPSVRVIGSYAESPALYQVRENELDQETANALAPQTLFLDVKQDLRVFVLEGELAQRTSTIDRLERTGVDPHELPERLSPSSFLPLPAVERAHPYRQSRLADPAARARAIALAGEVDPARLEQTVVDLSTGPGNTRFSGRPEVNTFARPYLIDALAAIFSAPGDTIIDDPFPARVGGVDVTLYNVIARRRGETPGSGKYVLGAHYDATASRTPGWNSATEPAPGADDNGSGVACVLEAARILTQDRYDFDLEFALFGGEEQVLLGSKAYVADSLLSEVDQVIGAIVLDMVGYNPRQADSLNVLTNFTSEWLADLMHESEAVLPANHGLDYLDKVVSPTTRYSDHAAYWDKDRSAILFIENVDIVSHNRHYHQVTDDVDYLLAADGPDLMRRTTEVVVASLGQFALGETPPIMTFAGPGLVFHNEEEEILLETRVGETVFALPRVMNAGPTESDVQVHGEVSNESHTLGQSDTSFATWGSGVMREIRVPFLVTSELESGEVIEVEIQLSAKPGRTAAVTVTGQLEVDPGPEVTAFVAPNPVRGGLGTSHLWLTLPEQVDVEGRVVDVLGSDVGAVRVQLGGARRIPMSVVVGKDELPSGLYLLKLKIRQPGGGSVVTEETIPFAVAR